MPLSLPFLVPNASSKTKKRRSNFSRNRKEEKEITTARLALFL
jgi:hypothetical protein